MRQTLRPVLTSPLLGAALLLEGPLVGMALLGDLAGRLPGYLALHFVAFGAYLAALVLVRRGARLPAGAILVAAAVFRITLLVTPPTLSSDIHRFVWDGRVQASGRNPYVEPPDSPRLAPLRDDGWRRINHKEIRTIYPPFAQTAFHLLAAVGGRVTAFKAAWVVADLGLAAVLVLLLWARRQGAEMAIVYAWNPLVVVEVASSGHYEPLAMLFLFSAYLLAGRKPLGAGLAFALSVLTKWFPLPLAPLHLREKGKGGRVLSGMLLACIVALLPYAAAGSDLLAGLRAYGGAWRWNDGLFRVLALVDGGPGGGAITWSRVLAGAAALGVVGYAYRRRLPDLRAGYLFVAALLLLGPVVHPWYLLWLLPFLCFHPNPAFVAWSGLVPLAYHARFLLPEPGDPWTESPAFWSMEYVPVYVLLLGGAAWRWRKGAGAPGKSAPGTAPGGERDGDPEGA